MGKEIFTSGNIEIEKKNFYCNETPIFLRVVDTEKVLVSNKNSFGEKSYNTLLVSGDIKKEFDNEPIYNK